MKIVKKNDSTSSPLQFIVHKGESPARVVGQMYSSKDNRYHLACYVPYKSTPRHYLCGEGSDIMSPSRREDPDRAVCALCYERLALGELGE